MSFFEIKKKYNIYDIVVVDTVIYNTFTYIYIYYVLKSPSLEAMAAAAALYNIHMFILVVATTCLPQHFTFNNSYMMH